MIPYTQEMANRDAAKLQPLAPIAFSLQWPGDVARNRINISTTFDTEAEAREYADKCLHADSIKVVPLYLGPVDMQGARDEH